MSEDEPGDPPAPVGGSFVFDLLEHRPQHVERVARWWFDEWGHETPGLTVEALCERTRRGLNAVLPVTVLALDGAAPDAALLGVAELKAHELFAHYPGRTPWLGGVFVDPAHRGRGAAAALVREVERLAATAGFRRIHLQTEAADGGLYARIGWRALERIDAHGSTVTVMERVLDPPT